MAARGSLPLTVALLAAGCAVGWAITLGGSMAAMGFGMPPDAAAAGLFMAAWVAMVLAMMMPAVAPMVITVDRLRAARGEGWSQTGVFALGYVAVWGVAGLIPLALSLGVAGLPPVAGHLWPPALAVLLAAAGLYQLSPAKSRCLRSCRAPLGFFMTHGGGPFRLGATHGIVCLGCCWALMALLVGAGAMNPLWMVVLALLFLLEKVGRRGVLWARLTGAGLLAAAAAVILF